MNTKQMVRAGLLGLGVTALLVATAACNSKGACVQTFDDGKTFTCSELTQSVCTQGKGDKFVGGTCPAAGFTKKAQSTDNMWEK